MIFLHSLIFQFDNQVPSPRKLLKDILVEEREAKKFVFQSN